MEVGGSVSSLSPTRPKREMTLFIRVVPRDTPQQLAQWQCLVHLGLALAQAAPSL